MEYKQCNFCVMDTTAEEIVFDDSGRCNFCKQAELSLYDMQYHGILYRYIYNPWTQVIKESGAGRKYDCLIGLSGGADSSTVLHHAVKLGLRPLCFSVDNGYNNPQADLNILQMVEKLKVPFYRYVLDLEKFKELQAAFMKAGVKNIEIPTDHILMAASLELADKYSIKYILSGGNVATESIMPRSWGYQPRDLTHIKAIYKKFTGKKLSGLPLCGLFKWNWYKWVKDIKTVYPLDYLDYNRNKSAEMLATEYNWGDVGQKHEENDFTKWFQSFYLYEKFGIDKRLAHYSSMIVSGQMTRAEAMKRLEEYPEYPKFGIEKQVLKYPKHDHYDYPTDEWLWGLVSKVVRKLRRLGLCSS